MTTKQLYGDHYLALDLNPRQLILERQVRHDPVADEWLVASIRERGVLQPIVVTEPEPDRFVVLAGHRRTLAAIEAGLASVPVSVVRGRTEADRIADQLAENDHRATLPATDRAAAYEQLALIGLSVDDIARMTATPAAEVEQLRAIARSKPITEFASERPDLDLVQLAAIAEFADVPEILEELLKVGAAHPGQLQHTIDYYRQDQREKRIVAGRISELQADGVNARRSSDVDGAPSINRLGIPAAKHADCPGRLVGVQASSEWVDGSWELAGTREFEYCSEPQLHQEAAAQGIQPAIDDEAKKVERRRVIRLNKQWRAAQQTRRDWVKARGFRKWVGGDHYVVSVVTHNRDYLNRYGVGQVVDEFVGAEPMTWPAPREVPATMSLAKAKEQTLGVLLAAGEADLPDDGWQQPRLHLLGGIYLRLLEANGYELCHTELLAAGCDAQDPDAEADLR